MSYARWTTQEEVVKNLKGVNLETGVKESGTPITYDDQYLYIDSRESQLINVWCPSVLNSEHSSNSNVFKDVQFIYRESLFQRKNIFEYKDIDKLELQYTRNTGRCGGRGKTIFIYFKKRKRSDVHIEIQYEAVKHLIEKKSSRCQVKIEFYSLRIFSKKYRELLKDYLTGAQKEEIARLIAEKEAKRKKATNKWS